MAVASIARTISLPAPPRPRVLALDAFRGIVLVFLLFEGIVPAWSAHFFPGSPWAALLSRQFTHAPWEGARLWDLGQPGFMFMSGIAISYAIAARLGRGLAWSAIFGAALRRSVILIALGAVITIHREHNLNLSHDVLTQLGLATPFAYLIVRRPARTQIAIVVAILVGYWLLFVTHAVPGAASAGLFAHFQRDANFAADFDRWFLNLFPRAQPFDGDLLGLSTLNFIPTIATIVVGALAGQFMQSARRTSEKCGWLAVVSVGFLAGGWVLGQTVCPIVKPIWTPSWTIFSAGWALLATAVLYWVIDVWSVRRWTYPFVVLGANALMVYVMLRLFSPLLWAVLNPIFGAVSYTLELVLVNVLIWLAAAWLRQRRIVITV